MDIPITHTKKATSHIAVALSGCVCHQRSVLFTKIGVPELTAVYSVVNWLSVIPLVAGIAGFFAQTKDRRQEKADAESRKEQSDQADSALELPPLTVTSRRHYVSKGQLAPIGK